MSESFTEAELEAYLEEALGNERAAEIEKAIRNDRGLLEKLATINSRRDSGVHSIGEIWRRHQLSVPTREELGGYLLGILSPEQRCSNVRIRSQTFEILKRKMKGAHQKSKTVGPNIFSRLPNTCRIAKPNNLDDGLHGFHPPTRPWF